MTPLLEALGRRARSRRSRSLRPGCGRPMPTGRRSCGRCSTRIARGLLTLDEGDERVAAAYAARFLDELPRLTADLPPAPASAPVAPGWSALALLARLQVRTAVAGLWRGIRRAARSRPPRFAGVAVATVALLALLTIMAATAAGGVRPRRARRRTASVRPRLTATTTTTTATTWDDHDARPAGPVTPRSPDRVRRAGRER